MFNILTKLDKEYDYKLYLIYEGELNLDSKFSEKNIEFIKKVALKQKFTGKKSEVLKISIDENEKIVTPIFIGFGKKEEFNEDIYREVIFETLSSIKGKVSIESDDKTLLLPEVFGEIVYNINYSLDCFKEKKESEKLSVDFILESENKELEREINLIGATTDIARDLVNLPANIINPTTLSERVVELGKEYGFEVEILDESELIKLGMNLLVEVGKASETKSKFIVMRYLNSGTDKKIALVGKGLTYDTGGLCIKPDDSMFEMKSDMAGAGTVIATMCAVAKMGLKTNLISLVPACENAVGGNAYRPSDIIKSMSGKTVEIINTDAEGRLALADALTYAVQKEKATEIIDVATLTGAILVALGTFATGVFSNSDKMYEEFEKVSLKSGEKIWRMPLFEQYRSQIVSEIADIKNIGVRMGGVGSSAKFLEEFVEKTPWIHLDIAGTAYDSSIKWLKKGATGVMIKTLYNYVKSKGTL